MDTTPTTPTTTETPAPIPAPAPAGLDSAKLHEMATVIQSAEAAAKLAADNESEAMVKLASAQKDAADAMAAMKADADKMIGSIHADHDQAVQAKAKASASLDAARAALAAYISTSK